MISVKHYCPFCNRVMSEDEWTVYYDRVDPEIVCYRCAYYADCGYFAFDLDEKENRILRWRYDMEENKNNAPNHGIKSDHKAKTQILSEFDKNGMRGGKIIAEIPSYFELSFPIKIEQLRSTIHKIMKLAMLQ